VPLKMETDQGSDDVDNMAFLHKGGANVCSAKYQNSNWTPKAWIWRVSNAAMVVFFVTAAYVQVLRLFMSQACSH